MKSGLLFLAKAVNELNETYQDELAHYGIAGMKWGIRRYQNPDGTLTPAGRRRYGTAENLERGMTKKQAAVHDTEKQAAINSGKTSEVQKFSSELTRDEMAHALQRIRDEQTLSDLRAKDVAAGQQKVKAIIDAGGQLKTAGETVKNLYNFAAQVNNAFNKDNKMPIIGEQSNNKKAGEKSVEQQTKEFALERMKVKAQREDQEYAEKQSAKTSESSNKTGKSSETPKTSTKESSTSSNSGSKSTSNSGSKSTVLDRMANNTGTSNGHEARNVEFGWKRDSRGGRSDSLSSSVNSFLSTPSTIEKINAASDSVTSWLKSTATTAGQAFNSSVSNGDDWVRRRYGV